MATAIRQDIAGETARMQAVLAAQKASFTAAMPESLAVRTDRIDRAIAMRAQLDEFLRQGPAEYSTLDDTVAALDDLAFEFDG